MENQQAQKLINRMQAAIIKNEVDLGNFAENFRTLREFALEEELPRLVKACRLAYQHIDANNAFLIPIPGDEAFDEEHEYEGEEAKDMENDKDAQYESLDYLLSLMSDSTNKLNAEELREYNEAFEKF